MIALLLLALAAITTPAHAASFDCARAATVTEKAICATPALSQLDERAIAAYDQASQSLALSDHAADPAADLMLKGHQDWTAARNRCAGASNCLLQQYLRRLAVLGFKPDPGAPNPLDPLVGTYGTSIDPPRELVIMSVPGNQVLVGVRVNATDWTCVFSGIGRAEPGGGLRVTRTDFDGSAKGAHSVLLTPTRLGLALRRADPRDDVSAQFCGAGGALEQPFPRR